MSRSVNLAQFDESDVAIIGMALRLPGAKTPEEFWQNLRAGVESITFFTDEELRASGIDEAILQNPAYVKAGGVLDDIKSFDASFFGLNPREAQVMDPQHRLFLECAWEVLEHAGYDADSYTGRISVHGGAGFNTYLINLFSNPELIESFGRYQTVLQNLSEHMTTFVSYKLNLRGPSMTVQTGCSTSLVAVHLACQSLLNRETDMALAGGVALTIPQRIGYLFQEGGINSPDGHCRAFDARAHGTVGGSGAAIVLLKRLTEAVADGDCIHAVIKGSAINNDGSAKIGYTAPSVVGQAEVIAEALSVAGIEPETIAYVETHGTGTLLGDPIEVAALIRAYRAGAKANNFCAIGSVKTNIGHTDTAAGVTGLIKAALILKHRAIPPSLHYEHPNPGIDFANSPFFVNSVLREITPADTPCRAAVSAFGIGGTNAHAILEEAPVVERDERARPCHLLVLSAKTGSALETMTANLAEHLKRHSDVNLADVAYTLQVGRKAFNYRRVLACRDVDDAVSALERLDPKRVLTSFHEPGKKDVVFMFSGQGAQYAGMGRELYEREPFFREQVDRCAELLIPDLGLDLREVIYPPAERIDEAAAQLQETFLTQPALFVIDYAMAQLWRHWGVQSQLMIGHSLGEYVAATLAGVFSLEDALKLVAARGRLMSQLPGGAMLAVPLTELQVQPFLGTDISLAAVNSPALCVLSGSPQAIEKIEKSILEQGLDATRLHVSVAFHSHLVAQAMEPLMSVLDEIALHPPRIPYVSNVTGKLITADEATNPAYWARHLRQTVRFSDGLNELLTQPELLLLEVGPGRTLSTLVRQHPRKAASHEILTSLRHPGDRSSDMAFLLNTVGRLWLAGIQPDWPAFYADEERVRVPLPTYPFERERLWVEIRKPEQPRNTSQPLPGKAKDIADWFYLPSWKATLPPAPLKPGDLAGEKLSWLIFSDDGGLGARTAERLKSEAQEVVTAFAGEHFAEIDEANYFINPQNSEHYYKLIHTLAATGRAPQIVLHCWSVCEKESGQSRTNFFRACRQRGYDSLLYLAQAMAKEQITNEVRLMLVSNGMQEFAGEDAEYPEKITALGPCFVMPQEFPKVSSRSVEIVVPSPSTRREIELIDQLISESKLQTRDRAVIYRGKQRFVQTFEKARLESQVSPPKPLRQKGVYLITGGTGRVGLLLAEYLARTVAARLILIGHSLFPERAEWNQWIETHVEGDRVSRAIGRILQLEESGAEVLVLTAEVADEQQMRAVLGRVDQEFGELHGVIHAAGDTSGGAIFQPILETEKEEAEKQFQAKAQALYVLENVLAGRELDFCLLFSSTAAVLCGPGVATYAAVNQFMNAFASQKKHQQNINWISVAWDSWNVDAENEMARAGLDDYAISAVEAVEAFKRIVTQTTVNHLIVSTGDLNARLNNFAQPEIPSDENQNRNLEAVAARPALLNAYVAATNPIEQKVIDIWQEILGVSQIGVHDNFFELGGHSLLATQVISRLRQAFDLPVPLRAIFENPTAAELAVAVEEFLIENLEDVTDEEAQRLLERIAG
jgi:acyl transferase domain-containing protein/acyl carrier protein